MKAITIFLAIFFICYVLEAQNKIGLTIGGQSSTVSQKYAVNGQMIGAFFTKSFSERMDLDIGGIYTFNKKRTICDSLINSTLFSKCLYKTIVSPNTIQVPLLLKYSILNKFQSLKLGIGVEGVFFLGGKPNIEYSHKTMLIQALFSIEEAIRLSEKLQIKAQLQIGKPFSKATTDANIEASKNHHSTRLMLGLWRAL